MQQVFLITGASKGFDRVWAEAPLDAGHKVVATARDVTSLSALAEKYGDQCIWVALDYPSGVANYA